MRRIERRLQIVLAVIGLLILVLIVYGKFYADNVRAVPNTGMWTMNRSAEIAPWYRWADGKGPGTRRTIERFFALAHLVDRMTFPKRWTPRPPPPGYKPQWGPPLVPLKTDASGKQRDAAE